MSYEIRSPYRPFTRDAMKALHEYGIVEELPPSDGMGRGAGVLLEELPPESVLDDHELDYVRDPVVTFETGNGETVCIYVDPDSVIVDNVETTMAPDTATEYALNSGWELLSGDPETVRAGGR